MLAFVAGCSTQPATGQGYELIPRVVPDGYSLDSVIIHRWADQSAWLDYTYYQEDTEATSPEGTVSAATPMMPVAGDLLLKVYPYLTDDPLPTDGSARIETLRSGITVGIVKDDPGVTLWWEMFGREFTLSSSSLTSDELVAVANSMEPVGEAAWFDYVCGSTRGIVNETSDGRECPPPSETTTST